MIDDLTPAEQELIDACARGEVLDRRVGEDTLDDPANAEDWGPDRTLRAEVVRALATGAREDWPVHEHGVQLAGFKIEGELDLESATLPRPLRLERCALDSQLLLAHASTRTVHLSGSILPGVDADSARVDGDLWLNDRFHSVGEVNLVDATGERRPLDHTPSIMEQRMGRELSG